MVAVPPNGVNKRSFRSDSLRSTAAVGSSAETKTFNPTRALEANNQWTVVARVTIDQDMNSVTSYVVLAYNTWYEYMRVSQSSLDPTIALDQTSQLTHFHIFIIVFSCP